MMYNLDLSRILSKWRVIAPAILISAANVYADCADCEAYKTQVANDCDSIISSCYSAIFDCQTAEGSAQTFATYYGSNTTERAALIQVAEAAARASGTLLTLKVFAQSIKSTAQSLQCNASSNSCDCATYLQSIVTLLTSTKSTVDSISITLGSIEGKTVIQELDLIETTNQDLVDILTEFLLWDGGDSLPVSINDIYNTITNSYRVLNNLYTGVGITGDNITAFTSKFWYNNINNSLSQASLQSGFDNNTKIRQLSLVGAVKGGFVNLARLLASLNNYSYTNFYQFSSIVSTLDYIKDSITNKPSVDIWSYVQEVDRSPLDGVSSQYFVSLTNEYLQRWSANDNPNTNWFRRVEVLLAALVFRDSGHQEELEEIEDDLPSSSDLSSLESALDASELFDVDIGGQFFDGAPSLPDFGSQLPQTLVITIPSFGGDDSQSASTAYSIEIDVNSISSLCDAVRACFRFLWWGLVALLVFFLGRWFLRGCAFAFRLIQGVHFS